jgi:hypothetical protein
MERADESAAVDQVRRRLLVASGRYVAPAILLTLVLDVKAYGQASCAPSVNSCGPYRTCSPGRGG